jgi:hypothetical protein
MKKFNELYSKIIMEMTGENTESIKIRVANLFKVQPTDNKFIQWNKFIRELNNDFSPVKTKIYDRMWKIYDEHQVNSAEEACWLAIDECSDEELLSSWKSFISSKSKNKGKFNIEFSEEGTKKANSIDEVVSIISDFVLNNNGKIDGISWGSDVDPDSPEWNVENDINLAEAINTGYSQILEQGLNKIITVGVQYDLGYFEHIYITW